MQVNLADNWSELMAVADERHRQKEQYASHNDMTDSSSDRIGMAGEAVISALTGLPFDRRLRVIGDQGWDLEYDGVRYDVKTSKKGSAYLIDFLRPPRADILLFVVVDLAAQTGECLCWATANQMVQAPIRNFGFGERRALRYRVLQWQGQAGLPPTLRSLYEKRQEQCTSE